MRNDGPPPEHKAVTKKTRFSRAEKLLLGVAICLGLIVLLSVGALIVGIRLLPSFIEQDDPEPPYDADLRIELLDIPDEENAYYYFTQAVEAVNWPEENDNIIHRLRDGKDWDQKFVDELLADNSVVFEHLRQGLGCVQSQVQKVPSFNEPLDFGLLQWRRMATLGSLQAWSLFKARQEHDAFGEALKTVRLGQLLQNSRGCAVHFLSGIALKHTGLRCLRTMVPDTRLPPEILLGYVKTLSRYRTEDEALANTFRAEYVTATELVDQMMLELSDEVAKRASEQWIKRKSIPDVSRIPFTRFLIRPNRTKQLMAEDYRFAVENMSYSYNEIGTLDFRSDLMEDASDRLEILQIIRTGNAVGEIIRMILSSNVTINRVLVSKCDDNNHVSATQLLIALKCYKEKTGTLPDTLDELVPEYFDAVPIDDFDGKPMRYSREKKIVYSVGPGLEDTGGDENGRLPWTFKIEF